MFSLKLSHGLRLFQSLELNICMIKSVILKISKRSINISTMDTSVHLTAAKTKQVISEGKAEVLMVSDHVFYNPVQEFNRDLSIAVLSIFSKEYQNELLKKENKGIKNDLYADNDVESLELVPGVVKENGLRILEALSATGLRSIRYAKEVPGVKQIVANDLSAQAVESIKQNIKHNTVEDIVITSHDDACMVMYKNRKFDERFTVIDLDPYGCPSIFLDGAVQSLQNGGLLLVTATDMAVLAGNSPETCYSKYGAVSLKTKCCHEMALRILLQCIESHANRYGRYIIPLLSISADFYIRVFVKIYTGAIHCKKTTSKLSMVYQCVGCDQITLQPLGGFKPNPTEKRPEQMKGFLPSAPPVKQNCQHCNQRHHMGGPIWSGLLHNEPFVMSVLDHVQQNPSLFNTSKRIEGILRMVREELNDVPLYYTMDKLFSRLHLETMPMLKMRSAILNSGHRVSYSHACKNSIKTDAPGNIIWDIMRRWEQEHPVKKEKLESDLVAKYILSQPITSEVNLSERPDANPISRRDGFLRFQFNPTPHWGPGTRASARVGEEKITKSVRNQNKKRPELREENKNPKRVHSLDSDNTNNACKKLNAGQTENFS